MGNKINAKDKLIKEVMKFINAPLDSFNESEYLALYTKLKKSRSLNYNEFQNLRSLIDAKHHEFRIKDRPKLIQGERFYKGFSTAQLRLIS